jgi:hypothetical protein
MSQRRNYLLLVMLFTELRILKVWANDDDDQLGWLALFGLGPRRARVVLMIKGRAKEQIGLCMRDSAIWFTCIVNRIQLRNISISRDLLI